MGAENNLFASGVRMVHEEAVDLTLASLRAYWPNHQHAAVAWSGGKDSTATLTLLIHLIDAGHLPQPECLYVFYADTRQELPPIQQSADLIMTKLRERNWIKVIVVRAPLDKRFMVYILGRGVADKSREGWLADLAITALSMLFTVGIIVTSRPNLLMALFLGTGLGAIGAGLIRLAEKKTSAVLGEDDDISSSVTPAGEVRRSLRHAHRKPTVTRPPDDMIAELLKLPRSADD